MEQGCGGLSYGGTKSELMLGNNLVCDNQSNLFHVMNTSSEDMATPQSFQEEKIYGQTTMLTKFVDASSEVNSERT